MKENTEHLCQNCYYPAERRERIFFWRGRFFNGLVCMACNTLYDDPEDSFFEHVKSQENPEYHDDRTD